MTIIPRAVAGLMAFGVGLGVCGDTGLAYADFKVRSPIVEEGEVEFEHNGSITFDRKGSDKDLQQSYTNSVGYGVTNFWQTELESEWSAEPGSGLSYEATTWENILELTPQGKYWADLGFFAEYSLASAHRTSDAIEFGPIVQKEWGATLHTANIFFAREIGRYSSDATEFSFAWQSSWELVPLAQPTIEYYADVEDLGHPGTLSEQEHRLGPVLVGVWNLAPLGKIRYEAGYLFGLTSSTENGTVRWRFEYEYAF